MGDTSAMNADDTSYETAMKALGFLTATFHDDHGAVFVSRPRRRRASLVGRSWARAARPGTVTVVGGMLNR